MNAIYYIENYKAKFLKAAEIYHYGLHGARPTAVELNAYKGYIEWRAGLDAKEKTAITTTGTGSHEVFEEAYRANKVRIKKLAAERQKKNKQLTDILK